MTNDFLLELAKGCVVSANLLNVIQPHLKYSFLNSDEYKSLFKSIFDYHAATQKSPTLGILSQQFERERAVLSLIAKMRDISITPEMKDQLVDQFEKYIKDKKFLELHQRMKEFYEKGDQEKAFDLLREESTSLVNFSLKASMYSRVFRDFKQRQNERKNKKVETSEKCPTGIPPLDHNIYGGVDKGTAMLAVARSGTGKSTFLRFVGYSCAFRGLNVVHFQAEGTKEAVEKAYDSMWTGIDMHKLAAGQITNDEMKKIEAAQEAFVNQCGEIFVVPFEQFHSASIAECRNHLLEISKTQNIDVVIFDYLEKFDPGDGKHYKTDQAGQQSRKLAVAEKIVNIAVEFNVAAFTATQASDIKPKEYNDPDFVITRSNIANLKATVDPFAYCITLNQTDDEYENDIIRIHKEKLREYKIFDKTVAIAQERGVGRFVDLKRTKVEFWDDVSKKPIRYAPKPRAVRTPTDKPKTKSER